MYNYQIAMKLLTEIKVIETGILSLVDTDQFEEVTGMLDKAANVFESMINEDKEGLETYSVRIKKALEAGFTKEELHIFVFDLWELWNISDSVKDALDNLIEKGTEIESNVDISYLDDDIDYNNPLESEIYKRKTYA